MNLALIPAAAIAAALFFVGSTAFGKIIGTLSRLSLTVAGVILSVPGILYVVYYAHLFDNAAWFYNFRAMPYSELLAGGVGFAAGCSYRWLEPDTLFAKITVPTILAAVLCVPFLKPLLGPIDDSQFRSTASDGVCLQSTPSTCGPCSAVTLLKLFNISSSEHELARESYSYRGGTENWYLVRALRRRGVSADVQIRRQFEPGSIPYPSIAGVVLPGGAGHFIAILDANPQHVVIGDPLVGKVLIPTSQLSRRYHFTGFFVFVRPRIA